MAVAVGVKSSIADENIGPNSYKQGLKNPKSLDMDGVGAALSSRGGMPTPLADHFIGFLYEDIYDSINLSPRLRELVLVAGLIAINDKTPELQIHMNEALNLGWTVIEMQEVILQMSVYSGLASSINGMNALENLLDKRKERGLTNTQASLLKPKRETVISQLDVGAKQLEKLEVIDAKALQDTYKDVSPNFAKHVIGYAFGSILSRPELGFQTREILTIAALTAIGASNQLAFHIKGALNLGIPPEDIADTIILVGAFSGFPSMAKATNVLKVVLKEQK